MELWIVFLVYAEYGKAESKKIVVLGSATIKPLQETGFASGHDKESKECVVINVYAKENALDNSNYSKLRSHETVNFLKYCISGKKLSLHIPKSDS